MCKLCISVCVSATLPFAYTPNYNFVNNNFHQNILIGHRTKMHEFTDFEKEIYLAGQDNHETMYDSEEGNSKTF